MWLLLSIVQVVIIKVIRYKIIIRLRVIILCFRLKIAALKLECVTVFAENLIIISFV